MKKYIVNIWTKFLDNFTWHLPPKAAHTIWHIISNKKIMHWKKPITYDEKLRWLVVNVYGEHESIYADKVAVREYVKTSGYEDMLIPVYGVWENVKDIRTDNLPEQFVLKCNHGSGKKYYAIIQDKKDNDTLDKELNKLSRSLKVNFGKHRSQYHYQYISPKIYCEKILKENGKDRLTDYKVVCAKGVPYYILVCTQRDEGRDYFDVEWNYMPFVKEQYRSKNIPKRPGKLEEMLKAAAKLSTPFLYARVDFYCIEDKVYFGEITLSPSSCNHRTLNEEGQRELGAIIELPLKKM